MCCISSGALVLITLLYTRWHSDLPDASHKAFIPFDIEHFTLSVDNNIIRHHISFSRFARAVRKIQLSQGEFAVGAALSQKK